VVSMVPNIKARNISFVSINLARHVMKSRRKTCGFNCRPRDRWCRYGGRPSNRFSQSAIRNCFVVHAIGRGHWQR
jgi:hypothetical protein